MRSFDVDPRLDELLGSERQQELLGLLYQLSGAAFALHPHPMMGAESVEFHLESVGWLVSTEAPTLQAPAARLLEFILYYVGKYRLAANLHCDTTEANYAELERQHVALQESEARYKALSEQLQMRVDEQVRVIEKTHQQLYESARLRAIGQLAAGVAHEINNPIGFIASNLRVAGDYLNELSATLPAEESAGPVMDDFRALLRESVTGAQRIAAIVADLNIFSNIDQSEFVPCDLNALIDTACHLIQAEHHQALNIELNLGELPQLAGYPAKIYQALFNVLDNAAKAVAPDGKICVISRFGVQGAIEVVVEDNGCGIADEHHERLFEPFFTTRPVGSGTGLGLTVVRDIMAAHQGEILVHGQLGVGTQVILCFRSC